MDFVIKEIDLDEGVNFCKSFRKEHVDSKKIEGTRYIGGICEGKLVGVVGYLFMGNTVRYKSDCVHPNYRGAGIYSALFAAREEKVRNMGYICITAFCTSMSLPLYLAKGFIIIRKNSNGIVFVRKVIV